MGILRLVPVISLVLVHIDMYQWIRPEKGDSMWHIPAPPIPPLGFNLPIFTPITVLPLPHYTSPHPFPIHHKVELTVSGAHCFICGAHGPLPAIAMPLQIASTSTVCAMCVQRRARIMPLVFPRLSRVAFAQESTGLLHYFYPLSSFR